jgi:hypothetical protein
MTTRKIKSGTIDVKALLAEDEEFLRALAPRALPGCCAIRAVPLMPWRSSSRSMTGSPRDSIRPTSKRLKRCSMPSNSGCRGVPYRHHLAFRGRSCEERISTISTVRCRRREARLGAISCPSLPRASGGALGWPRWPESKAPCFGSCGSPSASPGFCAVRGVPPTRGEFSSRFTTASPKVSRQPTCKQLNACYCNWYNPEVRRAPAPTSEGISGPGCIFAQLGQDERSPTASWFTEGFWTPLSTAEGAARAA